MFPEYRMVIQLVINPDSETSGNQYLIPEPERIKASFENVFQFPDGGILFSKEFTTINPDFTVKYDSSVLEYKPINNSPFNVAPHRGNSSCPYYEAFQPGSKIYTDFQAAWWKPMFNGVEIKLTNREERIQYLKSIGKDELVKEFLDSHNSSYRSNFCLFCFQNNYLRSHIKHLERITDEFTGSAKTERVEANSYISFRMIITPTTDYRGTLSKIFKQDAFPVKRWSYVKLSDTEIKGIYQTFSNNMIKTGYIARYYRGDFQQSRCLSMDDVGSIIGATGVVQGGNWDED